MSEQSASRQGLARGVANPRHQLVDLSESLTQFGEVVHCQLRVRLMQQLHHFSAEFAKRQNQSLARVQFLEVRA